MTSPENKFHRNSDGVLHRVDGPAIELADGSTHWLINGKRHRNDGPACEFYNGTKEWWINGERHRDDGPAIEYANGSKQWFIKGKYITEEVNQWIIDNNFPQYDDWNDKTKILFKLKFG